MFFLHSACFYCEEQRFWLLTAYFIKTSSIVGRDRPMVFIPRASRLLDSSENMWGNLHVVVVSVGKVIVTWEEFGECWDLKEAFSIYFWTVNKIASGRPSPSMVILKVYPAPVDSNTMELMLVRLRQVKTWMDYYHSNAWETLGIHSTGLYLQPWLQCGHQARRPLP